MAREKYKSVISVFVALGVSLALFTAQVIAQSGHAGDLSKQITGAMAKFTASDEPQQIPAINFHNEQGQKIDLSAMAGKVVLINFWATWCGPCRREMKDLDELQAQLGGSEFMVVALSSDRKGIPAVRKFYDDNGIKHLLAYNDKSGKAQRTMRVFGLPTTLLLDRRGRELGRLVGSAEWSSPEAVELIRAAIERAGG